MSNLTIPITPDDHSQGRADAKCTLVEYGDYQCPACGQAAPVVKELQQQFGSDLRLRSAPRRRLRLRDACECRAALIASIQKQRERITAEKYYDTHP